MNALFHICITLTVLSAHLHAQDVTALLFISDTQQPLWIETLRLKEHDNERMTQRLFSFMAQEPSASALFHLGDITSVGMLDRYWRSFDTLRLLLSFPVHPAFGNHEYFFVPSWGKAQMLKRFPELEPSWYRKRFGATAVIILNSNFDRLTDEETVQQMRWYQGALDDLENDSTVTAVIVACHHSPFTNSTVVSADTDVRQHFVRPFLRTAKGKAFIAGHAHTREHFVVDGKDFFVIGGGGGLQQPLKNTSETDWFGEKVIERQFFHYIRCELRKESLVFQIRMVKEDGSGVETVEEISVQR